MAGYFLARIPELANYLSLSDLLPLTRRRFSDYSQIMLAKLVAKVAAAKTTTPTKAQSDDERAMLAWLIQQTDSSNLNLKIEATRALGHFTHYPQTLIQLGKQQASSIPIVAQTALKTIANSQLGNPEVIRVLKEKLKDENPALVVEAIAGLIQRQSKNEMTWVVTLFRHPSSYVKINLIQQLMAKSETEFLNLVRFFTKGPQQNSRSVR